MSPIVAKDIMVSPVIAVPMDTSCMELMQIFIRERITGVPVLDNAGELVGIISLRDVIRIKVEMPYTPDMFYDSKGYTKDFMTTSVYTALPDTPVETIAQEMFQRRVHRTIVVDVADKKKPIGIITTFDLLQQVGKAG